ncbi:MAG: coproporphyrinogen III oxidase [Chloroflexi bacterium]|nr:MAG: radical SAM family heme chaperone HemW [Chloroflexota bacterium]MCQ3939328.1 coproporphyrinogen III oxidase [Chloroflexota bacterium]MDL1940728.1 radical SAM family heme chaperone HemW [Chloroflexi bacterium CFX2]
MTPETSIYLHIPFCKHRCAYCDFNTYADQEAMIPAYVNALIKEIEWMGNHPNRPSDHSTIKTIFFGGGTPSLLSGPQFASVMSALSSAFALSADAEVTIEANPGTISPAKLDQIRRAGINRISFGVQSSIPEELRMLEREHDFFTVLEAVSTARKAGFDNLNLDLIYGLPEQTLESWQTTVKRVVDLHPEHISAYALTLEHGTPFGKWAERGLLPLPDPDLAADMYEWTMEFPEGNGYEQYEISNWARTVKGQKSKVKDDLRPSTFDSFPEFACKHNLQYWRSLPYLGFGAGAHGYSNGCRYSNVLRIKTYIDRITNYPITNLPFPLSPAAVNHHKQTQKDDISDYMINNLRLIKAGVADSDFRSRFGSGLLDVFPKEMEELLQAGLLEKKTSEASLWRHDGIFEASEVYRLTRRGRLLGNRAFLKFIG